MEKIYVENLKNSTSDIKKNFNVLSERSAITDSEKYSIFLFELILFEEDVGQILTLNLTPNSKSGNVANIFKNNYCHI